MVKTALISTLLSVIVAISLFGVSVIFGRRRVSSSLPAGPNFEILLQ